MKSPFVGMDPYIEASNWPDFHHALIEEVARRLSAVLPSGYVARTGKRSYIAVAGDDGKEEYWFTPDVKVTAPRGGKGRRAAAPEPAATAELDPIDLRALVRDDFEESFIDIFELTPDRRLVTSVEILSPANKREGSEGWWQYLRKRQALLLGEANLVEIDLLRGGTRFPMIDGWPDSPYTLLVCRVERAPRCQVWRGYFDRPLPVLPIPLAPPHPDVPMPLQELVDAIYAQRHYDADLDYRQPLEPPLTAEERAWFEARLREVAPPTRPARKRRS